MGKLNRLAAAYKRHVPTCFLAAHFNLRNLCNLRIDLSHISAKAAN